MTDLHHHYGAQVAVLDDPVASSLLARLCAPETVQPTFNRWIARLYERLFWRAAEHLPRVETRVATRMAAQHREAVVAGEMVQRDTRCVVVDVARAGILPSQVFFDSLNELLDPAGVRQDHLIVARTTGDDGHVAGSAILGGKIGGTVDGATVFLPDPMGATGASVASVIAHYRSQFGVARRYVCVNLIVTPQYLRAVTALGPDVHVVALRVDRGMSPPDVLAAEPGARWSEESGLNEHDYIVPGGGGFGELMNNSWV